MRTIEQIQKNPQITHFNRHQSMDSETRSEILSIIRDVRDYPTIENSLYGLFDGYDYSEKVIFSQEFAELTKENSQVASKISEIFSIVEKYPRVEIANNGIY